ncbi:MFS transporter [Pseudomonas sp. S2_C03]
MKSTTATADSAPQTPAVRWALVSLSLSMLLSSLGTSIANVGLPTLAQVFDASFQQVQWVVLAYLLAITTLIVSTGRLGDLVGRRRLLLTGIAVFSLASLLCSLAPTLGWLIGARTVQGLGAAAMMALTMAFAGATVPRERTGSAMGLLGTMSAIGTATGPSLGGLLIEGFGWQAIFLVSVPLGALGWFLAYRFLPADRPRATAVHEGFDLIGTALLAMTLAAYALAVTLGRGHFAAMNLALLLGATVGLGLFVFAQTRVASPLIRLTLFRNPVLSGGLAMSTLVATVIMTTLVIGPFYLAHGLGLQPMVTGLVLAVGPCVAAVTGLPAGRVADRFGAQRMTTAGLVAMALGCLALSLLPQTVGIAGYVVPMVVLTLGYAVFQTANNTTIMSDVTADRRGVVAGMISLSRNLGLITGASVMGAVFAFAAQTAEVASASPQAIGYGMRVTYGVAFGLILLALALSCRSELARDS